MRKLGETSLAVGLYSLLTVLTTTAFEVSSPSHSILGSSRSLSLPQEGSRFTESLVIVGTLDGKLRALDPTKNGAVQWSNSVSEESLFSSSLSSVQMMKEFTGFRLIPSLDGGLFQFSWDSIEAIPLTADTLLSSSFKLNEGIGLVGGKSIQAMGVDPKTGKVLYSCSNNGCSESDNSDSQNDILLIKRTQKTIRAVSERTGAERWNFSVGQHKLDFLSGNHRGPHERISAENPEAKRNIQVSIPDGLIAGVKDKGKHKDTNPSNVLWQKSFDVPIAAVWWLENGILEKLDLLKLTEPPKTLDGENLPLMYYIGSHEDQLYVHPSHEMQDAVKVAIDSMMPSRSDNKHALVDQAKKRIIWKPYLATSSSRTPAIIGRTDLAVRKPLEYPFDNGHYFYGQLPSFIEGGDCVNNNTGAYDDTNIKKEIFHKLKRFVVKWWRELTILLFTVAFCIRQIFKYWYKCIAVTCQTNVKLTMGDCSIEINGDTSESNKQMSHSSSTATITPQDNFVSRYQCDFEHEVCLGKGAFGVVFQARNKLDDCQYAVKRIRLPNNHEARNKVMREVKVLATLDHPGIIRYYNSWCEEPPVEWLRDWDEKLKGDSRCPTLTSIPSLTEESVEDKAMFEISASEELLNSKSSRKRLGTLNSENQETSEKLEEMFSGGEPSTSFDIEFHPHSFSKQLSNDNRKLNDESSVVVFQRSDNSVSEDSFPNSSTSRNESRDSGCSSVNSNPPLHLLYIQMQLCERDSLKDWLNTNLDNRDYSMSIDIFKQLLDAVDYIHQKGHIHRDLKPSNILFARDGVVKVGDFGLVAACGPNVKEDNDHGDSKTSSNHNLTGQVGTQLYMSPEQMKSRKYCSKIDIYSLGIIFFELFHVFYTQMERHNVLTSVRQRKVPEQFCNEMPLQSELVLWLLAENAENRPSAQEISSSTLFKELLEKLAPSEETSTTPSSV